ncbi:MAG: MarR family winged helix-turn-helix transcriptional regulator [Desulfotomaculales bacterium]
MPESKRAGLMERLEEVAQQLVRRMHAKIEAEAEPRGITGSQFYVLKLIHRHGQMTVTAVAEEIGVSLSAVTALVDRLVRGGLVYRSRDEVDRRLVRLEITPQGKEVLASCLAGRKKLLEDYLGQLSVEDLEQLVQILEKLLTSLKQEGTV